ncbi:MAG: hypothetical protein HGA98_02600 [Deltaproteobacteria bacterium]|nr:hypothetical protein [Deltaproteobacteria bacterium]
MEEEGRPRRRGFLGFFGLDSRAEALEAFLWTLPYLGVLVLGLGGLSWLVQTFFSMPAWVHVLAIALAIVYFFFFLCRLRRMSQESDEPPAPGTPGAE